MPRDFMFPDREARAWVPLRVRPVLGENPETRYISLFSAIARLKPGVTPAQAAAEGSARGRGAPNPGLTAIAVFGSRGPVQVTAVPVLDAMTREVRGPIIIFLVAVALLLATATANVASVQLARSATRRPARNTQSARRSAPAAAGWRASSSSRTCSSASSAASSACSARRGPAPPRPADVPAGGFPACARRDAGLSRDGLCGRRLGASRASHWVSCRPCRRGASTWSKRSRKTASRRSADRRAPEPREHQGADHGRAGGGRLGAAHRRLTADSELRRDVAGVDRGYDVANMLAARTPASRRLVHPRAACAAARRCSMRPHATPGVTRAAFTTVLPLSSINQLLAFDLPPSGRSGRSGPGPIVHAHRQSAILRLARHAHRRREGARGHRYPHHAPVVVVNRPLPGGISTTQPSGAACRPASTTRATNNSGKSSGSWRTCGCGT